MEESILGIQDLRAVRERAKARELCPGTGLKRLVRPLEQFHGLLCRGQALEPSVGCGNLFPIKSGHPGPSECSLPEPSDSNFAVVARSQRRVAHNGRVEAYTSTAYRIHVAMALRGTPHNLLEQIVRQPICTTSRRVALVVAPLRSG